jgi:hypothetical protein
LPDSSASETGTPDIVKSAQKEEVKTFKDPDATIEGHDNSMK